MEPDSLNRWLTHGANLGIILGIVFLIIEIQQNTEVARSAAEIELSNQSIDFFLRVAENKDLSRVMMNGDSDVSLLKGEEVKQYLYTEIAVFMLMEGAYKQYLRGFLPEEDWKPYEDLMVSIMDNEIVKNWWSNGDTVFSPEFERKVSEITGVSRNSTK